MSDLREDNDDLRDSNNTLRSQVTQLRDEVERLREGWDAAHSEHMRELDNAQRHMGVAASYREALERLEAKLGIYACDGSAADEAYSMVCTALDGEVEDE